MILAIGCSLLVFAIMLFIIYILYKYTTITVIALIFTATVILFYEFFEDMRK